MHDMVLQWQPTREGYLRFLTESKQVYDTVESIIAEAPFPECEHLLSSSIHLALLLLGWPLKLLAAMVYSEASMCRHADERFQNTGLERAAGLAEDIAWMQQEYGLAPVQPQEDGPGLAYSRFVVPDACCCPTASS